MSSRNSGALEGGGRRFPRRRSPIWKSAPTFVALAIAASFASLSAADLQVEGLGWLDNRAAEQKLKLLLGGQTAATVNANTIEDAALVLISELNGDGYLEPALTVEATMSDGRAEKHALNARLEPPLPRPFDAQAVTLTIAKGRRFTLREIGFTGLLAMTEKEGRSFFVGENTLVPLAGERIYSPGRLQRSAGNLEEALRRLGYAEAQVSAEQTSIDAATGDVKVMVTVKEGPRWMVDSLRFEIADGSPPPERLATISTGLPWTPLWRQDTLTAIRRGYFQTGHPDVQVSLAAQTAPAADGTAAVTALARVTPGPEVHVGEVRFTGNTHTRNATLRRLVRSDPGELLNPIRFNNSLARISQLGVFRSVDLHFEPADGTTRDAVYELVEGRRQEVNLLAGYGSYEQLRGGVEWRHYNLFGRAHTDSLKLIQSMKSTQGDYTYTVPALFGTVADGSLRLFGWRREEFSFVNQEYGANLSVLWPLRRLGLSATTGYTFKHLRNAESELGATATDQNQADIASVDIGVVRDRRDNPLRPRKGYKVNLQAELADRALGGEVVYQQLVLGASYHTSWGEGRWVHAGLTHGIVTTLGSDDSDLPVSVRFHPGGDGSIRGYRKGEAAPRNADGLFVGAKAYLQFNVELEQALTPKWSIVAFADALGTAVTLRDYPFSEKLFSAGLGVRYQTIIGPIRLEYGRNLNPRPLDPGGTTLLSVGFPF
ncbi:MAG TPA: BamA/TamA family outer membrane protein [Lacunisphaera sp.]|nr:BamA/TamA family outer membrane protein [Lacunisphaera sp.]